MRLERLASARVPLHAGRAQLLLYDGVVGLHGPRRGVVGLVVGGVGAVGVVVLGLGFGAVRLVGAGRQLNYRNICVSEVSIDARL